MSDPLVLWQWQEDLGRDAYAWNGARDEEEARIMAEFCATATGLVRKLQAEVVREFNVDEDEEPMTTTAREQRP